MNPHPATGLPLRDIYLPEPVGWWPPAPGWWFLAVLAIVVLSFALRWLYIRQQTRAIYRTAMAELESIRRQYENSHDSRAMARDLSALLRRIAISIEPRNQCAGLTGESWLAHLDLLAGETIFNNAVGQELLAAPYQPETKLDADTMLEAAQQWLQRVSRRRPVHA